MGKYCLLLSVILCCVSCIVTEQKTDSEINFTREDFPVSVSLSNPDTLKLMMH